MRDEHVTSAFRPAVEQERNELQDYPSFDSRGGDRQDSGVRGEERQVGIRGQVHEYWHSLLDSQCTEIVASKRKVYTSGSDNIIRNFQVSAALKNSTPGAELATHLIKQVGALVNILCDPTSTDSEADTRFADARNYIDLAYTMYKEGKCHERIV